MTATRAVALVNGPWQAISLAASLRCTQQTERVLAVLVDMAEGSRLHETTRRILQANGIGDTLCIAAGTSRARAEQLLQRATDGALRDVECLATYGVHRPMARFLCNLMPRAALLIYEDGLRAYVEGDVSLTARMSRCLRAAAFVFGRRFALAWRDPRRQRAQVEYALLLTSALAAPREARLSRLHAVPNVHMQDAITRATPSFADKLDGPYFLIVGQYYSTLKQMTYETEIERYAAAADEITRRGVTPVWRGHIRSDDGHYAELKRRCPALRSFSELVDDASYPLELYASLFDARCAGAVSFSSSALFYLRTLYDVPTYTLLSESLVRGMSYPHKAGCALALANLPQLLPTA